MQGIGAAGVTTVVGKPTFAQQEEQTTTQEGTAVRFVHAVPGAPEVAIFLEEVDQGSDMQVDGQEETGNQTTTNNQTETNNQTTTDNQTGTDNQTTTDNQTAADDQTATDTQTTTESQEPVLDGLQPREVSSYQPVDPGTYTLRIEPAQESSGIEDEQGETETGEEAGNTTVEEGNETAGAGGDTTVQEDGVSEQDQQSSAIIEMEIELPEQTTYTGVAYGEPANGAGTTPEDTPAGEEPTDEQAGEENESADTTPPAGGENDSENTTAEGASILQPAEDSDPLVQDLRFGEAKYVTLEPGEYTLEFRESEGFELEDATGVSGSENGNTTDDDAGAGQDDNATVGGGLGVQPGTADSGVNVALLRDRLTVEDELSTPSEDENVTSGERNVRTGQDEKATTDRRTVGQQEETSAQGMSRVRVFHGAQNIDAVDVVLADGQSQDETVQANETGSETPTAGGQGEPVQQAQISTEAGVVYSGFAVGNFDPMATAEDGGVGAPETGMDNATDDTGMANATGDTGMDNAMQEDEAQAAQQEPVADAFELLFVEDARDGERADGGTEAQEDEETVSQTQTIVSN